MISNAMKKFVEENSAKKLFGEPSKSCLGGKTKHVLNVVKLGLKLNDGTLDDELLEIVLKLHDIGRSIQWKVQKSFDDRTLNHRFLGLQMIAQYIRDEKVEVTPDWIILNDVCQYHGLPNMYGFAHEMSLPYIKIVSLADDIENGCNGALGYLEDEKERDDKKYIASNPNRDQRDCKPELLEFLEKGQKFDKMKLCETYAEYFVFAAMLAVNCCLNPVSGDIAKMAMTDLCYCYTDEDGNEQWLDAVDGYCHIFDKHLHPEDAKVASRIMREKCR